MHNLKCTGILLGLSAAVALAGCAKPKPQPVAKIKYVKLFDGGVIRLKGKNAALPLPASVTASNPQDAKALKKGIKVEDLEKVSAKPGEKVTCHKMNAEVGSRLGKRLVCLPAWRWKYIRRTDSDEVWRLQQSGLIQGGVPK